VNLLADLTHLLVRDERLRQSRLGLDALLDGAARPSDEHQ
jgi:hypothetical protein